MHLADEQQREQLVTVALRGLEHDDRVSNAVLLLDEQVYLDEVLATVVLALDE